MVFDIIVLIVVAASALLSFLRGFIREVLTIVGLMGGLAAAYYFGPSILPMMNNWLGVQEGVEPERVMGILPYDMLAEILSYGLIFIVVAVVLSIVSHVVAEAARSIGLGAIDRTLGVIFGIGRGVLFISIFYLPFHVMMEKESKEKFFEGSRAFFYIEQVSAAMANYLPESTVKKIEEDAKTIQDGVKAKEGLDALKNDQQTQEPQKTPSEKGNGYNEEFREQMDKLFENKTDNSRTP